MQHGNAEAGETWRSKQHGPYIPSKPWLRRGGGPPLATAWPASFSRILVGYPNGTALSLTGKCTGGVKLDAINGRPAAEQAAAVRTRWCEIWLDPLGDGNFRAGWVYGKFIAPL